jgi:hypothetical protein
MGTRLTDDDRMTWSRQYKGQRLGEVPDHFWRWFLQQDWCDDYPDYVEYANLCVED